ncbi:MAG: signal peptidase I [Candidatus Cloacimonetes bacterium]|nr:signal peptidase I [Candidatus Cloacimonadota bacterium]
MKLAKNQIKEKHKKGMTELDYTVTPLPEGQRFRKHKPFVRDWVEAILFAFVVAMIIRNYTFQNFMIPSSSMEKTLLVGDYLVANKMKYLFKDPQRDEIVTFRYPKIEENTPEHPLYKDNFIKIFHPIYINKSTSFQWMPLTFFHITYYARKNVVKRVIGMPGDTIEVRNKEVYVNGELYKQGYECYGEVYPPPPQTPVDYIERTMGEHDIPEYFRQIDWYYPYRVNNQRIYNRDWFGPIKVPAGKYFVMGDNRDVSEDSRYWGFLDRQDITGTPFLIFFSKGIEYNKLYDSKHIRWDRIFRLAK